MTRFPHGILSIPNEGSPETTMGNTYLIMQPSVARNGKMPNLEPLAAHGTLKVLVAAGEYPTFHPGRCLDLIANRLSDYDPERDLIAWVGGDTLAAVLTGVVLADMAAEEGWPRFRWLRYERGRTEDGSRTDVGARYLPIWVPFQKPLPDEDQLELPLSHEDAYRKE